MADPTEGGDGGGDSTAATPEVSGLTGLVPSVRAPVVARRSRRVTKFLVPDITFGDGVLAEVGDAAKREGGARVFVVSDPGVVVAGWTEEVIGYLRAAGLGYHLWSGLTPNPKDREVHAGCRVYAESGCDVIVAVGGGSSIDAAKAIAILTAHGGVIHGYAGVGRVPGPLPPMTMVPTTCGSGSDVSQFCVVTDTVNRTKITIGGRVMMPDVSVTDPRTLTTLPAEFIAYTGLDVLSHAIEAYVSKAANFLSDSYALAAVEDVTNCLLPALDDPADARSREGLARASLQAGLAFSNALLGATHAISHQIGGLTDLPHGLLNAMLLPHVMDFNAPAATERLADVARVLGAATPGMRPAQAASAAITRVRDLSARAGVPLELRQLGLDPAQISTIAANALRDAYIATNPRPVGEADVRAICLAAW